MSDVSNLRDTIAPKSDQMNADDLIGTTKTIKVTAVKAGAPDQPIAIHYEGDDGKPYKPCKSMRRVLIFAWGDDGRQWAGKSMTLYCCPEVKFGRVKVGGIRISHLSDIEKAIDLSLTVTRAKRQPYHVKPLAVAAPVAYPADVFAEKLPAMIGAIESGKMTTEQVIAHCEKTGTLSDAMKARLVVTPTEEDEF